MNYAAKVFVGAATLPLMISLILFDAGYYSGARGDAFAAFFMGMIGALLGLISEDA